MMITKDNFSDCVAKGISVVNFYADWCPGCGDVKEEIDKIKDQYDGAVRVYSVNIDCETELAVDYNIFSIPCVILFNDGEAVKRISGAENYTVYASEIEHALAN